MELFTFLDLLFAWLCWTGCAGVAGFTFSCSTHKVIFWTRYFLIVNYYKYKRFRIFFPLRFPRVDCIYTNRPRRQSCSTLSGSQSATRIHGNTPLWLAAVESETRLMSRSISRSEVAFSWEIPSHKIGKFPSLEKIHPTNFLMIYHLLIE